MLKRNWNWKNNRLFCHIFVTGEISIGGGGPCLRLCSKWGKQKKCSQIFREVSGVFQQNFNCSKNSAVLGQTTVQFSRTWGFEAKAKDFKMYPQGQGRPRGLLLWLGSCIELFRCVLISLILSTPQIWAGKKQRWSPRGQILKSLALASKVKSFALALASRPQVLENWPVLGSRTAVFFELLKFCGALEKFFRKRFFVEIAWKKFLWRPFFFFFFGDRLKNFCEDLFFFFFFGEHLRLCPWSLALASSIPVLGLESVCPRKGCPWPWPRIFFVSLALASSLVSSTPPLVKRVNFSVGYSSNFCKNQVGRYISV